jgi:flagellar protein FliO/FliZ
MIELDALPRALGALAFVVALIAFASWGLRRIAGGAPVRIGRDARRRLRVVESVSIDARTRLVLIRRDQVEHLLVVGAQNATPIETGIAPPAEPAA